MYDVGTRLKRNRKRLKNQESNFQKLIFLNLTFEIKIFEFAKGVFGQKKKFNDVGTR